MTQMKPAPSGKNCGIYTRELLWSDVAFMELRAGHLFHRAAGFRLTTFSPWGLEKFLWYSGWVGAAEKSCAFSEL